MGNDNNKLANQLNELKVHLQKWTMTLAEFKKYALENVGLLDLSELAKMDERQVEIDKIGKRIQEIEIKKGISLLTVDDKKVLNKDDIQKCYAIVVSDSGAPQKVGNSWQVIRTIEKKEVDCNKEYGFINIEGKVYKSDLSLDELMKSLPNFEEHLYANKGFSKEEFLTEVRQQSVTWQKYRDFEKGLELKGETKISFPVVWDLTPGTNTNGQEEGNISLFLEKRKALIENIYSDVTVCDTLEAQKSYFLFLMEFEDKYRQTSDRLKGVYKEFYEKIVVPEKIRMQGIIDNTPQDPLVAQLENSDILQGCVFKIVIQVNAKGDRIAGELQFLRKIASNKVYVEYERRYPDKDPQLMVHINTQQGNQIEDGFSKQLLQAAVARMSTNPPLLIPNEADKIEAVIFTFKNGISYLGMSRVHIEQAMGVPAPEWYVVSDGTVQETHTDSCGRAVGFSTVRTVTKIANPDPTNCPPSAINYNNIFPATLADNARIEGTNVSLLPATSLQSGNFTLTAIQQYFQKNPNASSYTVPLSWNTPLPFPLTYTVTDGPLQPVRNANGWVVGWTAIRTITAVIDPNCNPQINWNNVWSRNLNNNTAQPDNLGAGSGNLPTNAQNPLTLAQLNTLFAGVAGTQNMALNWNMAFNITPVTFAGNNNTFTPAPWFSNMRLFLIANPALNVTITGNTNFAPSASNPIPIGTGAAVWGHIPLGGTFSDGVGVAAIFGIDVSVQNMGNLMLLRAAAVAINLRTGIPNPGRVAIQRGANGPGANITITIGGVNVNSIP